MRRRNPSPGELPRWADYALLPAINLAVALLLSGLLVWGLGVDPLQALESLVTHVDSHAVSAEGPVLVCTITKLVHGKTFGRLAQYYSSAFAQNTHVYPYYGEQA